MVDGGYATALPKFSTAYVEAEGRARSRNIGMWASVFQPPAEYRAANPHFEIRPKPPVRHDRPIALPAPGASSGPSVTGAYFRSCAAARAAGASPLYRGQPGYGPHLDRDGDGVACEPMSGR
ncbi:MAG TPA: excalibur calcium-binding domain-containing protein [Novosphingobium sp.]|nr:excalibur calcium-binding domain-containing protein [Novosphingobium sp.]